MATVGKPAYRRIAGAVRRAAYRLSTPVDRVVRRRERARLPPAHLRIYYYRTWRPEAFARSCELARAEAASHGLQPSHRVLDIGSGLGNLAIGLLGSLQGSYDGLEIHHEAVAWCQRAITPRHPTFRFHRADVVSRAYNPRGRVLPSAYVFPFPDQSFDFVFLSSVFTHMLPDGVENYVREISRVLAPGGICVSSYFLLNDESRDGVRERRSFIPFDVPHASGLCRLHDVTVPESAVAIEEAFVTRTHQDAGLRIRDIRRGGWASGVAHGQDVVAAER